MKRQSLFLFKKLGCVHFSIQKFSHKIAPASPIQATKLSYFRGFSTVNNIPVKDASEGNTTTGITERILQKIPLTSLFQTTKNSSQLKNAMKLIQEDISEINKNIRDTLVGNIPLLNSVSTYYFEHEGKKFRPALVLLISQAIENHLNWLKGETIDQHNECKRAKKHQLVLAEVIEMIHTARYHEISSYSFFQYLDQKCPKKSHFLLKFLFFFKSRFSEYFWDFLIIFFKQYCTRRCT